MVAVVGGAVGSKVIDEVGNVVQNGQYLTLIDVSDPTAPILVQNIQVTLRPSVLQKVRWRAPLLHYLENSADSHFVGTIDLQELLIGFSVPSNQRLATFGRGQVGNDANGDGDGAAGDGADRRRARIHAAIVLP